MSRVEVDGVTVRRGTKLCVEAQSLELASGEIVALVGASGCGKTSLLRVIAGLDIPVDGKVKVCGKSCVEARREGWIAAAFQEPNLLPWLTAYQNAAWFQSVRRDGRIDDDEIQELIGIMELEDWIRTRRPSKMSGGEKQRVALIRAIASGSKLILLDEAFSAIDAKRRSRILVATRRIVRSKGLLVVSIMHDLADAVLYSDRILVHQGGSQPKFVPVSVPLPADRGAQVRESIEFRDVVSNVFGMMI